jgi:hypothetical protein
MGIHLDLPFPHAEDDIRNQPICDIGTQILTDL